MLQKELTILCFRNQRQSRHHRGRVAGLYRYNPAPSEPDLRLATHPAQASHKLQIVPECIC